jgi:hypothetical protein
MSRRDEYEMMRLIILGVRITGEESAPTCAAMLSDLDKAEAAGEPCPGYVRLLQAATPSPT